MKRLKDPIYGYIELKDEVCATCVDTPEFQRLRRIIQTSYAPLYPTALHNRFVHSLGVYYLGCRAADVLDKCVRELLGVEFDEGQNPIGAAKQNATYVHWEKALRSFKIACLLHDLGHAPFSHSGERYFNPGTSNPRYLDRVLVSKVDDGLFDEDVSQSGVAAEHEIMSAILGIDTFDDQIEDKVLFARAITGYGFKSRVLTSEQQLDNVLIGLLNSNTIDVDKLDYLIRDAYVVGFDSVNIDYVRLLDGLRVVRIAGDYCLAYHKTALSVLENVVLARDFEKKWIQSHPAVLYDQMLVQHAIRVVDSDFRNGKPRVSDANADPAVIEPSLFSEEALSSAGVVNSMGERVRLVGDEDVLYLAKNKCFYDPLVEEYFARNLRRHPLWKSEAEYLAVFAGKDEAAVEKLCGWMIDIVKWLSTKGLPLILNDGVIDAMETEKANAASSENSAEKSHASALGAYIGLLKTMKELCISTKHEVGKGEECALAFDFALIASNSFESGFKGDSFASINIVFPEGESETVRHFKDVSRRIKYEGSSRSFYYLYHVDASKPYFPKAQFIDVLVDRCS